MLRLRSASKRATRSAHEIPVFVREREAPRNDILFVTELPVTFFLIALQKGDFYLSFIR
jgi:hypothetical protein